MGADDGFELVELIQPDDTLFGAAPHAPEVPHIPLHRRRGFVPLALAATVALTAGVTLAVWQPWVEEPESLWLPTDPPDPLTLTDQLVIDGWTADAEVFAGGSAATAYFGHVFSDGTSWVNAFHGRYVDVVIVPSSQGELEGDPIEPIQGAPAAAHEEDDLVQIDFGPIDGWHYTVNASGLTVEEAVALAEVVRVDERGTLVRDVERLLGVEPRVSLLAERTASSTIVTAIGTYPFPGVSLLAYTGRFPVQVATSPASTTGDVLLAAAAFNLTSSQPTTVHGLPAVSGRSILDTLDVVVWVEGGRLIAVAAQIGRGLDVVELAERVRPATPDEWAELTAPDEAPVDDVVDYVEVGTGPELAVGAIGSQLTASAIDDGLALCVQSAGASQCTIEALVEGALLTVVPMDGEVFVVAYVPGADATDCQLIVRGPDGSEATYPLESIGTSDLSGPIVAVAVPPGSTVDLVIDGVVRHTVSNTGI